MLRGLAIRVICVALPLTSTVAAGSSSAAAQGPLGVEPAANKPTYMLDISVYTILPEQNVGKDGTQPKQTSAGDSITIDSMESGQGLAPLDRQSQKPKLAQLMCSSAVLSIHSVKLVLNGAQRTWNGRPEPDDPLIQTVANPRLLVQAEEPAEIRIGVHGVQYFEREVDGAYALRTSDHFVGSKLRCTVSPVDTSGYVKVEFTGDISRIAERKPVAGASLDVGLPVIAQQKFEGALTMPLDHWIIIPQDTTGGAVLLTLLYVQAGGK